jgi:periplasmic divalent cation tolerance protein
MDLAICLVTCPSKELALALAKTLVNSRLAACVQVTAGLNSVYRWKDDICIEEEALLIIKTRKTAVSALKQAVLTNHPYETPEFVVLNAADASEGYLTWVAANVTCEGAHVAEEVVVAADGHQGTRDHQE